MFNRKHKGIKDKLKVLGTKYIKRLQVIFYFSGVKLIECCGPHSHAWILYGPDSVEKIFKQAGLCISGPQTYLCAGTGKQVIKFRGTPATALFGNRYFSEQRSPEIACCIPKWH